MYAILLNTSIIPAHAEGEDKDIDFVSMIYAPVKKDAVKRFEIIKVLTGQDKPEKPYRIQDISDTNESVVANALLNILNDSTISEDDMISALNSFYSFQQSNTDVVGAILQKYQDGFLVQSDNYAEKAAMPGIRKIIEKDYYSLFAFINMMYEAKSFYNNMREIKVYNFLYVDENNNIQVYPDIEMAWADSDDHISAGRLPDFPARIRNMAASANSSELADERKELIAYLDSHALIDVSKRTKDGYIPDEILLEEQTLATTFKDLDTVPWAQEYIEKLAALGIVKGVEEGIFAPNNNVTREEFAKMLVTAFGFADETARTQLTDVSPDAWYYPYVSVAEKFEIVKGIGTEFGVGQNITRQDMAVMAYRAAQKANIWLKEVNEAQIFADAAEIADYAIESVTAMQKAGIINGVEGNRFAPDENATRAQAAKIIYLLIQQK